MVLGVSGKRWVLRESDPRHAQAICQRFSLPEIVGRILAGRHIALDAIDVFLQPKLKESLPDPFHLKDMDKAVDRLITALRENQPIMLLGDYDVDGATSTSLLYRYLKMVGAQVDFYIPDRLKEGYGPSEKAIQLFMEKKTAVLITLDCGTTAFGPLGRAQAQGLDVIVIDHHAAEPKLPDVWAVVNPNRLDENSPFTYLAAVGLAFLFAVALNSQLRRQGFFETRPQPDLLSFLDLVALGTVCDVMPLQGLNRTYVAQGLKVMAKRQNIGLKTLADVAGLQEKPTPYHLGFMMGPRINAGGRIGNSSLGTHLLTIHDSVIAQSLAIQLDALNADRQALEAHALEEAKYQAATQTDKSVIMVSSPDWHPGIIGIVAGRLKDLYNRPVFCLALNEDGTIAKGSGRSVTGFDLGNHVHGARQRGLLMAGGGHAMAAGITIQTPCIPAFQAYLQERLEEEKVDLTPRLYFEGFLTLSALTLDLCKSLEKLQPFGQGHPIPRFCFEKIRIIKIDTIGTEHLRLILSDPFLNRAVSLTAMAFRTQGTAFEHLAVHHTGLMDIVGTLQLDTWRGVEKVKLMIDDIRPHRAGMDDLTP